MRQNIQAQVATMQRFFGRRWIFSDILSVVIAITVFIWILLNRSPNILRSISLALRTGLNLTVGLYFVALYLAFRWKGWAGSLLSFTLTLALFAFPLAGLWAIGQSQPTVFNGIVPLFDADEYYGDALRLLAGQDFSVFAARRPLFPGLLSVVLWASHRNLMTALSVFTLITALACFAAAKEIQRTHGVEVAVFVLGVLFLFYRYHSGLVMSENLGLPLGTIAFAFLWRGTSLRNKWLVWGGILLLTLALNARAGTFFMLPLLLLWGGWVFKSSQQRFSWSFFFMGGAAVVLGFVINLIMFRLLAPPSGVPFANFSYSLYGLASGGNSWTYVFSVHPELLPLKEPYQSQEVYRLAFDLIRHQPLLMVKGAFYNWSMLFSNTWYSAYSFVSGENQTVRWIAQLFMFLLCILGLVRWYRNPGDHLNSLACAAALGVFVSVPFLPPTDAYRMRPYATSMIAFGLLPAMGLLFSLETTKLHLAQKEDVQATYPYLLAALTILLLVCTLLGPVAIKNFGEVPAFPQASCDAGMDLVSIRFDPGTYFSVIRQKEPGLDWIPNFHIGRFRRNSHDMADPNMIQWTDSIEPGKTLFYTLDYHSMENVLIVAHTDQLPVPGSLWQVCGERETEAEMKRYNIFYVRANARVLGE